MGSTFQDGFGSENDRKHPTNPAFLLLALFPSSSLSSSSSSSSSSLASDDHWLPLKQEIEFKVESFASKLSGVWRSKILSFSKGQMQTPLKIGYYRPLSEGFEKVLYIYMIVMHFSIWFGVQNIFFFIFSEWFEGKNHSKHQF